MDRLAEEGIDFTRAYTPCSLYSPARASMLTGKWHVGTETGPGDYGREGLSLPGYGNVRESGEFRTYLEADNLANHPVPGDMNRSRGGLQDKGFLYEDVMPPASYSRLPAYRIPAFVTSRSATWISCHADGPQRYPDPR